MGPHSTWFEFLPGYEALRDNLQFYLGRQWTWQVFTATHFEINHMLGGLLVVLVLAFLAVRYAASVRKASDGGAVPPPHFCLRNLLETFGDMIYGLMEGPLGAKNARRYLPLIGSLFLFILFSNLLSLIPGFLPPTATLKTNVGLALLVFLLTHVYGLRAHGLKYLKHFIGPLWWLAPLMLPIELVSHIARPVSLSVRLLGNITADHKVAAVFFVLAPILVPLPFLVMGVFVCVVQAVVFSLLSTIYISTAIAHEEH
jgi:F-type H+-transporting ATPase subunit a